MLRKATSRGGGRHWFHSRVNKIYKFWSDISFLLLLYGIFYIQIESKKAEQSRERWTKTDKQKHQNRIIQIQIDSQSEPMSAELNKNRKTIEWNQLRGTIKRRSPINLLAKQSKLIWNKKLLHFFMLFLYSNSSSSQKLKSSWINFSPRWTMNGFFCHSRRTSAKNRIHRKS